MSKKDFLNRLERMRNRSSNASTGAAVDALTTDDVAEGSNLYYTQARFDTAFTAKDTDDLSEGGTNFYYTEPRFDTSFAAKDTDDLSEGATNLYYTQARFDAAFTAKDTDDLSEGSVNFYYTDERAQDAVGNNFDTTLTYDDITPSFGVATGGITTTQLANDSVNADKIDGADAANIRTLLGLTEMLTASRTYYVDGTLGSDTNDGLSAGAGAFATLQKAVDTATTLFIGPFTITVQVADATYSENVSLGAVTGQIEFIGNTTTPSNCVISGGSSACITSVGNILGQWIWRGFKTTATTHTIDLNGGTLVFDEWDFGSASGNHIFVRNNGAVAIDTRSGSARTYDISGGGTNHVFTSASFVTLASATVDGLSGAHAFSTSFMFSTVGSNVNAGGMTFNNTASITGKRYTVTGGGVVNTGGGGASYFPGNAAGTTASGGDYL